MKDCFTPTICPLVPNSISVVFCGFALQSERTANLCIGEETPDSAPLLLL